MEKNEEFKLELDMRTRIRHMSIGVRKLLLAHLRAAQAILVCVQQAALSFSQHLLKRRVPVNLSDYNMSVSASLCLA